MLVLRVISKTNNDRKDTATCWNRNMMSISFKNTWTWTDSAGGLVEMILATGNWSTQVGVLLNISFYFFFSVRNRKSHFMNWAQNIDSRFTSMVSTPRENLRNRYLKTSPKFPHTVKAPSGGRTSVRNWNCPLTGIVLVSGHSQYKG